MMRLSEATKVIALVAGAAVATGGCDRRSTEPPEMAKQSVVQDGTALVRQEQGTQGEALRRVVASLDGGPAVFPVQKDLPSGQGGTPNQEEAASRPSKLAHLDGALPEMPGHMFGVALRPALDRLFVGEDPRTVELKGRVERLMGTLIDAVKNVEEGRGVVAESTARVEDDASESKNPTEKEILDLLVQLSPQQLTGLYEAVKSEIIEPMNPEAKPAFLGSLQRFLNEWQAGKEGHTKYSGILKDHAKWLAAYKEEEEKMGGGESATEENILPQLKRRGFCNSDLHAEYENVRYLGLNKGGEGENGGRAVGVLVSFRRSLLERPNGRQELAKLDKLMVQAGDELIPK